MAHRVRVHGRVQGVFFRASTRRRARSGGVAGWVRNDPDGTVEAWLEGPEEAVGDLEDWMRAGGPERARVDHVDVEPVDPAGHDGFRVRH